MWTALQACALALHAATVTSAFVPGPSLVDVSSRRTSSAHVCRLFGTAGCEENQDDEDPSFEISSLTSRRDIFRVCGAGMMAATFGTSPSEAMGLVHFPCVTPLLNIYHLMRVGTTLLEEDGIWSTNPLFLTNREAALSDKGLEEVYDACQKMKAFEINPSVIKYSLAASAMDTASIVKDQLQIGQNRAVPEFTFMDPRAIGKWEMLDLKTTQDAITALDFSEAGIGGKGGRPPANDDGTPHETLADQGVRLRQLMSVLETQYSGDNILLIFPDGTSPALLSAMMAGIPYNRAHEFSFRPGEVRFDVNMKSALQWIDNRSPDDVAAYEASLARGKQELARLRSLDVDSIVNLRDQQIEEDRIAADAVQKKIEAERRKSVQEEQHEREARSKALEGARKSDGTNSDTEMQSGSGLIGVAAGAAAIGLVIAQSDGGNEENMNSNKPETPTTPLSSTNTSATSGVDSLLTELEEDSFVGHAEDLMNEPEESRASSSSSSSLYGPPPGVPPVEVDRAQAAKDAMDEYLESDDGGDAWLQIMAQIAQENDEEEEEMIKAGFVNGNSKNTTTSESFTSPSDFGDSFM